MTNSTQEAKTMEIENNEMVVRLRFDRPLSDEEAARMAAVMAEEMEFRDPSGGRYTSPGWGIGKARVLGVTQLLPEHPLIDMSVTNNAQKIAEELGHEGSHPFSVSVRSGERVIASWADDPKQS
jgi:hypothetical protein